MCSVRKKSKSLNISEKLVCTQIFSAEYVEIEINIYTIHIYVLN
jgi:hypothetical protein